MNRQRRKELRDIKRNIETEIENLRQVAADEEEYRDNMPENLLGSEKFDRAEEVVSIINDTVDALDEALGSLDEAME